MASSTMAWTWSAQHNDYYQAITNPATGQIQYLFYQTVQPSVSHSQASAVPQITNGYDYSYQAQGTSEGWNNASSSGETDAMPTPAPPSIRSRLPNFIPGTPEQGWVDRLDPSYIMRTGRQAHDFFKEGRVFATLFTESAGGTATHGPNEDAFTTVLFGQSAYSQIRRFVVVSARRYFVLACAISTYKNQGTLKRGCDPGEHALIYNTNVNPETCYKPGERQQGLYKEPIEVDQDGSGSILVPESRIRFGKIYSIEWNVKVKNIGRVVPSHLGLLRSHYEEEERRWGRSD
ncbi:hypothetical protein OPT61_g783 [Boeremia exigua]|uniref:Uncharacterized protein n=1 Tax=Boeremia exigua TaxID=749465 RepID=A0ACC2ISI2_9PLEO|nr:hypothetical protein OPT61_g783 [Boeremia exigua]